MSASSTPTSGLVRMNPPVFYFAATVILLFGLVVIAMPEQAGAEGRVDAAEVEALIAARLAARAGKDWAESDRIRDQLTAMGVVLEDGKGGTTWRLAD